MGRLLPCLILAATGVAKTSLPFQPIPLDSMAAFRPAGAHWSLASELAGDPRHDSALGFVPGAGMLVCNPTKALRGNLFTAWEHGDLELELEFLLPPKSNSGIYLQGRYEVQLFDSWGKKAPGYGDCGGIYQRWDAARGEGKQGFEGVAPRSNASRAPGLWQRMQISFRAPRFDANGQKTVHARFLRVVLNGHVIHENVEVRGPTRSAAFNDEKPLGPLMVQGDHGPIALRNLAVKRYEPAPIAAEDLRYKLYEGNFLEVGSYDDTTPTGEGVPSRFSAAAVTKNGKSALVFTGNLVVSRAAEYRFTIESGGPARLLIDGKPVVRPLDRSSQPGVVMLSAGRHAFRLDAVHSINKSPTLELLAEGAGVSPHVITASEGKTRPASRTEKIIVEPQDRVIVQRGFVPFEPRKRLYATSVGTPAGVHYAYDFETGALLRAWRGSFIDATDMWEGRGNDQVARPTGPALTFTNKPTVAQIESSQRDGWPEQADALASSQGYALEPDGLPVFLSTLSELSNRDRIAPRAEGGLTRTLQFKGKLPSWSVWVLLAESDSITPQPHQRGWIIGDREWYLDWPADAVHQPVVRSLGDRQQLAVPLSAANFQTPLTYSIVW